MSATEGRLLLFAKLEVLAATDSRLPLLPKFDAILAKDDRLNVLPIFKDSPRYQRTKERLAKSH